MNSSLPPSISPKNFQSEPENSIIQKQRKELQLLIAELKDRDKELTEMVAVHQRQLLAWDDDRQKILTLAERCNKMENELLKRNEVITMLTNRLKLLECQEGDWKRTLENTRKELEEISRTAFDTSLHCRGLEEKNQALSCSVAELSNKVGQLQVREQELLTMLKLKDDDILEATNHISEFTCKFKTLENALQLARMEESNISKEKENFKCKLKELVMETGKLTDDLSEKTKENNEQREEIIRLKQEISYLNNELMCSVESAKRKDHLLQSAKSKQLRTDTELSSLRQVYVKQQQDLQFLNFTLENSQEKKLKEAREASIEMVLSDLESNSNSEAVCSESTPKTRTRFVCIPQSTSQTTCFICKAKNRQQAQDADSKERLSTRLSTNSDAFQEGTFHCSETLPREEQAREGTWMKDGRGFVWASEQNSITSLPVHEHWLDSFTEPTKGHSPTSKLSDKFDGGCKATGTYPVGILSGQSAQNSPRLAKGLDASCSGHYSANKTSLHSSVTDLEWMRIFQPAKEEGGTVHSTLSSTPQANSRIKSIKAESSHDMDLSLSDLGSPCLTSTQKTSGPKRHEKILVFDHYSKLASVPEDQDSCSPMSKLQRRLAESQQLLADLERSYLLHKAPGCCPQGGSTPVNHPL